MRGGVNEGVNDHFETAARARDEEDEEEHQARWYGDVAETRGRSSSS